jgi:hypothetical protein
MRVRRGWIAVGVIATVLAGEALVTVVLDQYAKRPAPGETMALHGGAVTFRVPAGWSTGVCGHPGGECVAMDTPRGTTAAITVEVSTPHPFTGNEHAAVVATVSHGTITRSFTVDGVTLTRWRTPGTAGRTAQPAITGVSGGVGDASLLIQCVERSDGALVREGCEVVIGSLRLRR